MGDCGFGKFDKPVFIITFVAASLGVLLSPLRQGGLLHIYRPLNLEALKIGSWKLKNLEISVKIWRLTIIYILGGYAKKWPFFGVEHDKNTIRVSIYSKSAILICTKMSRGRDSECERLVASDNLIWHRFSKYGFLGLSPLADLDLLVLCG